MVKTSLTIIVGFMHDFAAGIWAATVLAVWWLERAVSAGSSPAPVLEGLQRQFFWIGVGCVALVFATGAGRGFSYVDNLYGEGAEAQRRRMLVGKHVGLFTVFGLATWWQYRLAFG